MKVILFYFYYYCKYETGIIIYKNVGTTTQKTHLDISWELGITLYCIKENIKIIINRYIYVILQHITLKVLFSNPKPWTICGTFLPFYLYVSKEKWYLEYSLLIFIKLLIQFWNTKLKLNSIILIHGCIHDKH